MSAWLIAALALLPPLAVAVTACARGGLALRLAAAQLASSLAVILAVVLTFVLHQSYSIDIALVLALLTLPASLLYAVFAERWL